MTTKTLSGIYVPTYKLKSPTTTLSITASGYLEGGVLGAGATHYAVINAGGIVGAAYGIQLAGLGKVTNSGAVTATGDKGIGIALQGGGTVTNTTSATIAGYVAIAITGVGGVVTNGGVIEAVVAGIEFKGKGGALTNDGVVNAIGTSGIGIYLAGGGTVTNGSLADTAAVIAGTDAIGAVGGAATVRNFGTISSRNPGTSILSAGVYLTDGGAVTNGAPGDLAAVIEGFNGVVIKGAIGTVTNFAAIGGRHGEVGAALLDGGTITNGSDTDLTAVIEGYVGAAITGARGTIANFGTLEGALGAGTITVLDGAYLTAGGVVTNGDSGDTSALIKGAIGVYAKSKSTTVTNFGTITDVAIRGATFGAGVALEGGGRITNGAVGDTAALISGHVIGSAVSGATGTVTNLGTIRGAILGGIGVYLGAGGLISNGGPGETGALISAGIGVSANGSALATVTNLGTITGANVYHGVGVKLAKGLVTNGSETATSALIEGYVGISASGPAILTNFGAIRAGDTLGAAGVAITGTGERLTNGSAKDTTASISGYLGVVAGAGDTVTNFGVIQGTGGVSVSLNDVTAKLYAEAGSRFGGQIASKGGLIEFVSGVATASGVASVGLITGAGTMSLQGGASFLDAGVSLTVARVMVAGVHTTVAVDTALAYAGTWTQTGGTLSVSSGDQLTFTGAGDSFSGTIAGTGKVAFVGGSDTFKGVTLSVASVVIHNASITLSGLITVADTVTVTSPSLIVASTGATLDGGGTIALSNSGSNKITGATPTAALINIDDKITGAGQLGAGKLALTNDVAGVIDGNAASTLTIDTGSTAIANAGLIEAGGGGGVVIQSAVKNTGTLGAFNSTLTVNANVTGAGVARINGGTADFEGAFSENVIFGATGQLRLAHSTGYDGTISGFSKTGANSLDLEDIAFATAKVSFSGTTSAGTITVSDGTHTAHIKLAGNYTASTFVLADDGGGGTLVHDPSKNHARASPPRFAASIAGLVSRGGVGAGAWAAREHEPHPTLARPRIAPA